MDADHIASLCTFLANTNTLVEACDIGYGSIKLWALSKRSFTSLIMRFKGALHKMRNWASKIENFGYKIGI